MVNATFCLDGGLLSPAMKGFGFRFALVFAAVFAALFMLVWTYLSITSQAEAATLETRQQVQFSTTCLEINSSGKIHSFDAELALSAAQHSHGLMFRKEVAPNYAMVFDFGSLREGSMWMKNTFVSLDILFADEDRKITFIKENAIPLSEDIISSPQQIRYVLEVAAGTVQRLGIEIGDSFILRDNG
ncbi:MAG: DUF192 domain-containing protein [Rhodospirillaceae bacterium]|nr:DUF192 domain-containing protein [Rhodospirillaceae bacterium]